MDCTCTTLEQRETCEKLCPNTRHPRRGPKIDDAEYQKGRTSILEGGTVRRAIEAIGASGHFPEDEEAISFLIGVADGYLTLLRRAIQK